MSRRKSAQERMRERFLNREAQFCFAAAAVAAILERQSAAVGFCDLAAEDEANSGAALFRGEEGHEEVGGVRNAGAFIQYGNFQVRAVAGPGHLYSAARFPCGVDGVVNEVDQKLFELVG